MSTLTSEIMTEPTLSILKSDLEMAIRAFTVPGKRENIPSILEIIFQVKEQEGDLAAVKTLIFAMMELADI